MGPKNTKLVQSFMTFYEMLCSGCHKIFRFMFVMSLQRVYLLKIDSLLSKNCLGRIKIVAGKHVMKKMLEDNQHAQEDKLQMPLLQRLPVVTCQCSKCYSEAKQSCLRRFNMMGHCYVCSLLLWGSRDVSQSTFH